MRIIGKSTLAAAGAFLLASCATAPTPTRVAVPVAKPTGAELPYRWTQGNAPQAHKDAVALFGPVALRPGQYVWAPEIPSTGDTKVVIDTLTQLFYVYRGDRLIGMATISTGKQGRRTPLGFWSVIEKKKLGFSRKYDNAPMPFMQMYDSAGIAFHAGPNPGYPASHGCVRLPLKFAEKLFTLTQVGSKVIIEG